MEDKVPTTTLSRRSASHLQPLHPVPADPAAPNNAPQVTILGKLVILLFIAACLVGGGWLLLNRQSSGGLGGTSAANTAGGTTAPSGTAAADAPAGPGVEINFAYGTEKERWLKWAVGEFANTREGKRVRIKLIPLGSLEGAQAALNPDKQIHLWSPASALFKDVFVQDWTGRYNKAPFVREEALALSPMVFVMWKERYDEFVKKYGSVTFKTLGAALAEPTGWNGIAGQPDWGVFKFGHTHPNESNSGLMTLVLMAYDFGGKNRDLQARDILNPDFQKWMTSFERGVTGLSNSTGNMMKEMVLKGPSSFDGLCVYENVAIDYLKNAEGRWGELRVAYPERNAWNDNPCYVLDAPWSSPEQRRAAGQFLDFLLTEPIQRESLKHGFRPANTQVPVRFPESPFVIYAPYGLRVDPPVQAEAPRAEVVNNLLQIWQRTRGAR